jgi:hypothetical protein
MDAPVFTGRPANAPEGRQPGMRANRPPEPRTPTQMQAGSAGGPGTRDGADPAYRPATTRDGVRPADRPATVGNGVEPAYRPATARESATGSRSLSVQGEAAQASPTHPPDQQAVKVSVPATQPEYGKQSPAGHRARPGSETPLWSASFLLDPLWDQSNSVAQQAREMLRSLRGDTRDLAAGNPYRKSLTQRWPAPALPAPFSGVSPIIGGAATGSTSSSDGTAPLLAVLVSCLLALACRGRSRTYSLFLRPGTVPRLALERPG